MSRALACAWLVLTGCGRIDFDPLERDSGRGDAAVPRDAAQPHDARALDAAAPLPDAGSLADGASPPDRPCPARAELCNGLDDDCDGTPDDGLMRVDDPVSCGAPARAGRFTMGGVTWDQADAVSTALEAVGRLEAINVPSNEFGTGLTGFDVTRSLGYLVGMGDGVRGYWRPFPNPDGAPPEPNVDRVELALGWGGLVLVNGPGPDFAIYDVNTPEGMAVRVEGGTLEGPSPWRWHFPDDFDVPSDVNAWHFELSDFGVDAGGTVDTIRLRNVFNADSGAPDRVRDPSGEGAVVVRGEASWDDAYPLLDRAGGTEFPSDQLDTDPIYVVALRAVVPTRCCPTGHF